LQFSQSLVNELGNIPRHGSVPKFSNLEMAALPQAAKSESIDVHPSCWLRQKKDRYFLPTADGPVWGYKKRREDIGVDSSTH
jgi:hypothetical protein